MMQGGKTTSNLLNGHVWITKSGEILDVKKGEMKEKHIRDTLGFIYRKRDWLLYNSSPETMKLYTPDTFFEEVIMKSNLWNELIKALTVQHAEFAIYDETEEV